MSSAIISSREHGEEAAACKSFEAVHDALVRPQYETHLVVLEECFDAVGTELDNVAGSIGVTHEVRLNTEFRVAVCWIRPKDIHNKLLLDTGYLVNDL